MNSHSFYPGIFICGLLVLGTVAGQANESRPIATRFDAVNVAGPFSVTINLAPEKTVKLQGNADVIKNIETVVEEGSLQIRFLDPSVLFTGILQIQVTTPELRNLAAAGPAQVNVQSPIEGRSISVIVGGSAGLTAAAFTGESLSVVVGQSASFIAKIAMKNLNAVVSGSAAAIITGTVDNANVVVSGTGFFHGRNLEAQSVSVAASGTGTAEVSGNKEVKATVSEFGKVRYGGSGKPRVANETLDDGVFEKME
ncbi:hypothetical protein BV898_00800 [Hypsibius exemplaris]|uniref:Putative auto-transporter adhesin head GIN domain-containing protein n=1 Tax=Hypsibius exemplaris TaxID=2072580 RepID=A0A1W0XCG7_HYPEX|nr:hypothetical protein BV898_00800 [Hypsibius exemplaris]